MIVSGSANPLLLGQSQGYNLTRSLRLRRSASAYLSKSWSSNGSSTTWTYSTWVKRGQLGITQAIVTSQINGNNNVGLQFSATTDTFEVYTFVGGASVFNLITTQVFRDPSAWYHIVLAVDTTQATSTNRVKLYVNGSQVTAFGTATYPALNATTVWNQTTTTNWIGAYNSTTNLFDGYFAETYAIDGQQLTPSSFGSTNTLTGVWQPAPYSGGSYGTNGFILDFEDNSALTTSSNVGLGKDTSGNGNYWTTNNISITAGVTYDSMTDVPTLTSATAANFAVANPLQFGSYVTLSNGNLTVTGNTSANSAAALATIGNLTSGKWYWEYTQGTVQSETCGICTQNMAGVSLINAENIAAYGIGVRANGNVYGGTVANITSWTTGDVIGIAVDCDNGAVYWSKNGTWLNSGVPTSGASKTGAVGVWTPSSTKIITPSFGAYNGGFVSPTFGQRPFTYTPPTGFVALNTYNLPTSTIVKGNTVMDATLYTGTGASLSVTNTASFKPDLVWVKGRSGATDHAWYDSVRGVQKQLESNTTTAETTETTGLTAFGSAGFTVGALAQMNTSAATYVGWQWQAGQGTNTTNTNGTITSTVSVNASAGFSVVTFAASVALSPQTVGHGLGVAPSLIIVKPRSSAAGGWYTYHSAIGATQLLQLNLTSAQQTTSGPWNNTAPTSSVFTLGGSYFPDAGATTYVAYCWTPIAGFSAFGSYTGNGSTDGPFVYTGFRPKFLLYKSSSSVAQWVMLDSARNTSNVEDKYIFANASDAEATFTLLDFVSNGFKLRTSNSTSNGSGDTYIYMAFAENPFKNSLAR